MDCLVGRRTESILGSSFRILPQATRCFPKIRSHQAFTFWTWKSRQFLRNLDRPRSKEEDGDENDKGNDAMLRHSSDTGSVHPSTLTPAGSFLNLAHVKPDSPRLQEKITRAELLLGVDLELTRKEWAIFSLGEVPNGPYSPKGKKWRPRAPRWYNAALTHTK